jgi:hypothetical protein
MMQPVEAEAEAATTAVVAVPLLKITDLVGRLEAEADPGI